MKVKAYLGIDSMSRLTERVLREFQAYMANVYGVKVDIDVVELPLGEGEDSEIPLVMVDGRVVSSGEPPSLSRLVEEFFNTIELEYTRTLMGFPITYGDLEESVS